MNIDLEGDFWKEHFSHVLHKNMVRIDADKLTFENAAQAINEFRARHPDLKPDVNFYQNYATFELFITPQVKLRLYIQNQVKASLLQFDEGDYVKIVDAKFPYNPFPEIEEFISHIDEYTAGLNSLKNEKVHSNKQMKVASQFIKAALIKKFKNNLEVDWNLKQENQEFNLTIKKDGKTTEYKLSPENFLKNLENL